MGRQDSTSDYYSAIREGKLSILEHFWRYSEDNMFIVALDEDNDFVVEDINPAQIRNFNINTEQCCGIKLKNLLEKQVLTSVEARYRKCLEQNTPLVYDESLLLEGKTRFWNTMIIPVTDPVDGKVRIFGIARELTPLINTKNALATLNAELEQTIAARTQELEESNARLRKQALTDTLTQVGNRRYFFKFAGCLFEKAEEQSQPVSLIYLDLDDFKQLNDIHGHLAGDAVLRELAIRLKYSVRQSDVLSRFGGEEFVILLAFTCSQVAIERAREILDVICYTPFMFENKSLPITSSIGVATITPSGHNDLETLIKYADKALYQAKQNGKCRVELY